MSESELTGLSPSAEHAFRAVQDGDLATMSRVTSAQRVWPLLLSNGGASNQNPMASAMDEDGFEYIRKIVTAGGFAAHAKAHRARLVATFVPKFIRIPADNIPLVVDFWAHVGFY
jgi:hypothetical protein